MQDTTDKLGPLLAEIRDGYRGIRATAGARKATRLAARATRHALERDLASYTSPSDLNDLDAILDRYSEEETADIRRILAPRRAA
jgi:putative NADH-flavin reductase